MRYFYTDVNRQPQGPEEREKILELLNSSVINSASLVAAEGSSSWHPISSLSAGDNAAAPPPLTVTPRPTEPLAIWSLVLSLVSFICCYLGFMPAIAGIVCGHLARGKVSKNANLDGKGLALAGLIIGYTYIALTLAYIVFILICAGYGYWESKHL